MHHITSESTKNHFCIRETTISNIISQSGRGRRILDKINYRTRRQQVEDDMMGLLEEGGVKVRVGIGIEIGIGIGE